MTADIAKLKALAERVERDDFFTPFETSEALEAMGPLIARIEELEAALERYRQDREYVAGWVDGFDHATEARIQVPDSVQKNVVRFGSAKKWLDDSLAALRARKALGDQP